MAEAQIQPHKITKPIQILAVSFAALVLLVASFLGAASAIDSPIWLRCVLCISAIVLVPLFLCAVLLLQTKYRPQLQDDEYYAPYLKRQEEIFIGFSAENPIKTADALAEEQAGANVQDPEARRIARYKSQEGLFLVHAWRPSRTQGQVADIVIWVHQHKAGPLTRGEVERVVFYLGPKFFDHPVEKTNVQDAFRLEVSAYYPMLCLAQVFLRGRPNPIDLERYVDFEVPQVKSAATPILSDAKDRHLEARR